MNKRTYFLLMLMLIFSLFITGCSFTNGKTVSKSNSKQSSSSELFPAYTIKNGVKKWGYIDNTGKYIISPQFDEAEDFQSNNIAKITVNKLVGLIDKKGNVLASPSYNYISDFADGAAIATIDSKNKIIDEKGKILFTTDSSIYGFKNGISILTKNYGENSLFGFIDKSGKVIIEPKYITASNFINNKALVKISDNTYELIDTSGNVLTTIKYGNLYSYSEDKIVYTDPSSNLQGYLNSNGKVMISAKFVDAQPFTDGFAIVGVQTNSDTPIKYGLINTNGEYVINPEYTIMESLGEGLYTVSKDGYGSSAYYTPKAIIDTNGTLLTGYKFYGTGTFSNGYCYVTDENSTYFIDKKGQQVTSLPKFIGLGTLALKDNVVEANIDQRLCYVTKNNKQIWKANNTIKLANGIKVNERKYRPDRLTLAYYPEISGLSDTSKQDTINKTLKEKFIASTKPNGEEENGTMDRTVDFNVEQNKNLLIIERSGYAYPIGAPHGMPGHDYYHINLSSGTFYTLSDLFNENSGYEDRLNQILKKDIQSSDAGYWPDAFKGITYNQGFHITKNALQIYFNPYEIAPYAAGFPTFDISYNDIKDVINTNSAFWKSFDKKLDGSNSSTNDSTSLVKDAISTYENSLNSAINKKDFSIVQPILYKDSNLYNDQMKLVANLSSQGITEKLDSFNIQKTEFNSDKSVCNATVDETITINYPNKTSQTKQFSYIYTLRYSNTDKKWQLSDIATK